MKQLLLFAPVLKMRQVRHGQDKSFVQDDIAGKPWSPALKAGSQPPKTKLLTSKLFKTVLGSLDYDRVAIKISVIISPRPIS